MAKPTSGQYRLASSHTCTAQLLSHVDIAKSKVVFGLKLKLKTRVLAELLL